ELSRQRVNGGTERAAEFGRFEPCDEGRLERARHFVGEPIHPAALDRGQVQTPAGEREDVIAYGTDHVLGLPQLPSREARPGVKCVEPRQTDELLGWRRGAMRALDGIPEDEAERRRSCPELRCGRERKVDLQRVS